MRHAVAIVLALCAAIAGAGQLQSAERLETLGLIADGPYRIALAQRIARAVDHRDHLRVLPVIGNNPLQSLADLLELRGIDLAIVPSDTLAFAASQDIATGMEHKLDYLVKLGNLDVHVVAGPAIRSLRDLAGKRVAIGTASHESYDTALAMLSLMEIDVSPVAFSGAAAIAAVREGQADAAVLTGVSPLPEIASLRATDGLHLVPVIPEASMAEIYAPALLTAKLYPDLLKSGETVETVSSALILAAVRWPRGSPQQKRLERFADALFAAFMADSGDAGINFNSAVPGWQRAEATDRVLGGLGQAQEIPQATAEGN